MFLNGNLKKTENFYKTLKPKHILHQLTREKLRFLIRHKHPDSNDTAPHC